MIVQSAINASTIIIASGQATLVSSGLYRLAYTGVSPKIGDCICVRFPLTFSATDTLSLGSNSAKPLKDISGNAITRIVTGCPVILANTDSAWIVQYLVVSSGDILHELYSEGDDNDFIMNAGFGGAASQYLSRSSSSSYTTYFDKTFSGLSNEKVFIEVDIISGGYNPSMGSNGGTWNSNYIRIYRNETLVKSSYVATSGNDMEGNIITRVKGHRRQASFRYAVDGLTTSGSVRVVLSYKGGRYGNTDYGVLCAYNVGLTHYIS